ncbi:SGNH/GDSL hydrolase family protein [uncultured Clostridium sp.]|uniref:SGNH/GDSL hydrolase family protein n=1 Tax=uncultured Clostridium sp. TaxID=59620 RepID=UPI0025FC4CCB|nr:SGNH/GDSL hydrolase family protein [uncultured Clostridium sp.]MDU4883001.1 SGNH/GDSL hydrolase family protein [Clostridium celatum]MDU7076098.1 SGNH/GDSL hydrolase family protein [Clostridium celatum]
MSIQNYLNQIKNAIFGKDVRKAIYDAIKQCYDDASVDHDNANMEVKLARGSHSTLNDRITENEKNQEKLSSDLDNKAKKEEVQNVQQQVNNLVLGAVGDGNNPEVLQARGNYSVLNERLNANENDFNDFTNNIGVTTVARGKNILFLKDQHFESNGLTVDIKDQLITVNGQVQSTGSHNFFELNVDMPNELNGNYSVYVTVTDGQSITSRNDVLRLRFYDSNDNQIAEKIAFNHLSLTDLTFTNVTNYKVKLMIQAQYTYTQTWSFNLQLASGHDGVYEKAYINRNYELKADKQISELKNEVNNIKNEIGIGNSINPLSKIITDGGLAGLIESYACGGDSLTQGVFDRTNGVAMDFETTKYYSYPSQLSRITGSKVFNLGNAGATACNSQQAISDWHSWLQTATQKNWFSDNFKAKAYIFAVGTNDIGYYGSFTGNVETDIDINNYNNNNTTTSVGGLATMIQKARELQPKAVIFIETIDNTRNTKITRDEANEKIRAIAKKLDCYLIDMAKYWISEEEAKEWMAKYQNGGHLNAMGYLLKTQARITYIDWIIRNNPEKFKEVQFIGTTMEYK